MRNHKLRDITTNKMSEAGGNFKKAAVNDFFILACLGTSLGSLAWPGLALIH